MDQHHSDTALLRRIGEPRCRASLGLTPSIHVVNYFPFSTPMRNLFPSSRWLALIGLHTQTGQACSGRSTISVREEARFPSQVTQSKARRILSSSLQEAWNFPVRLFR